MTTQQIDLIKTSWQSALVNGEQLGTLFFNCLFEIAPEVKPMFKRTTVPEQSKKLLQSLSYVISKLDKLEGIKYEVSSLAQRHIKYGVEEKHYVHVGVALIWTLENTLGNAWNEALKEAWLTCYGVLSQAMINAGNDISRFAA